MLFVEWHFLKCHISSYILLQYYGLVPLPLDVYDNGRHNSWWRHQMETFSPLLALCVGNAPVPGEFPAQRPVTRSFDGFLWSVPWINGWVNNREAGDLRRRHAHYDIIVMSWLCVIKRTKYLHCYGRYATSTVKINFTPTRNHSVHYSMLF